MRRMKLHAGAQCVAAWLASAVVATVVGQAQTFNLYDQAVLPVGLPPEGGEGMLIRTNQPSGQSSVPSLSSVGFIELYLGTHRGRFGPRTQILA